ncbi:MAG: zinc-dependent peptidase [Vulcanimicrobiota bacterium]
MLNPLSRLTPLTPQARVHKARGTAVQDVALPGDEVRLSEVARPKPKTTPAKVLLTAVAAVSGLAGLAGTASVLIHSAQKSPLELLVAPGTKTEDLKQLQATMAPVDVKLLRLAQHSGLQFHVVSPGDDMLQTNVLRVQEPSQFLKPELRQFADRLHQQSDARFDKPMLEAMSKLASDPTQVDYFKLKKEKINFLLDEIEASRLPVKLYTVPMNGPVDINTLQFLNQRNEMPASLKEMALVHGARSPQEIKEFIDIVKSINGTRIDQAIQQAADNFTSLKQMGTTLNRQPFDAQKFKQGLLKNSDMLPLDHNNLAILVPDLYYKQIDGQTLRLDGHDRGAIENWSGELNAKGELEVDGKINGDKNPIRGEYFYDDAVNRILLRTSETGSRAPIHELGHALDHLLQKQDPKFYQSWKAEVQKDYDAMMKGLFSGPDGTQPITQYATSNVNEYIAEGFAHYHLTPEEFKAKDPTFYGHIDKFVKQLKQLQQNQGPRTLAQILNLKD